MTLILTRCSAEWVSQVTDRLLTRQVNNAFASFDAFANKNVVFRARDAVVTIGYTGLAFLGQSTTDDWIADRLLALTAAQRRWPKIALAIETLRTELDAAFSTAVPEKWKSYPLTLAVGGIQSATPDRPRRLCLRIHKPRGGETFTVGRVRAYRDRQFDILDDPPQLLPAERAELLAELRSANTPDEAEALLAARIRQVAGREQAVGADCMCITLYPPTSERISVRYRPATLHTFTPPPPPTAPAEFREPKRDVMAAFSPWIITPGTTSPPQITSGGFIGMGAGPTIEYLEPVLLPGMTPDRRSGYFFPQGRPAPPNP